MNPEVKWAGTGREEGGKREEVLETGNLAILHNPFQQTICTKVLSRKERERGGGNGGVNGTVSGIYTDPNTLPHLPAPPYPLPLFTVM